MLKCLTLRMNPVRDQLLVLAIFLDTAAPLHISKYSKHVCTISLFEVVLYRLREQHYAFNPVV